MFGSRNFLFAKVSAVAAQFKLFSWGGNTKGELGLGNITNRSSPVQVGALTTWATPDAGAFFTLSTKTNGTLWSWGFGFNGNLGLGNTTNYSSPKQIGSLTNWEKPSAGCYNSACIKTDKTLWVWGEGGYGANGQGNTTTLRSPVQLGSSTTWTEVSAGVRCMLAVDNGKLFSWGYNGLGQLGLGNRTNYSSPVQVGALTDWAKPAASIRRNNNNNFSLCTKTDGTLWSWGYNYYIGALGLGNTTNYSSPKQIGSLTNWATPAAGRTHALCVKTDGTLWAWGRSGYGALGLGAVYARSSPVQIGALTSWVTPAAGDNFSFCIKNDGTLWAWGLNSNYGQLGLNDLINRNSPVQVGTLTTWLKVAGGTNNAEATQGVETSAPVNLTVPVVSGTAEDGQTLTSSYGTWSNFPSSFTFQWQRGTSDISGATSNTYFVVPADIGSTLRCVVTGINSFGSASANSANTATVTAFAGGQLWTWGRGRLGQLGSGSTANRSSPVQVGSLTTWTKLSGGYQNMFGITSTGQLWAWGSNGFVGNAYFGGSLGLGDFTDRSSPTQVGTLTDWSVVAGGGVSTTQATAAVKTDGTLWVWGKNSFGSLAGNATNNSPVQVGALTNWKTVSGGGLFFGAIKTDGTLWVWGQNNGGQLGLGDTTNRSSPVQVGSGTNWKIITIAKKTDTADQVMQAIKTDGTLWGWGGNVDSVLGTGNATNYSSPVQIGSDTNWSNVWQGNGSFSAPNTAFATKTDGTAWVWGNGSQGGLGLGNTTSYNSPVQLGALTNWLNSKASIGDNTAVVLKADNTLWSWGRNDYGQLGLGNTTNYSSPVQVGALTTWRTVRNSPCGVGMGAIKIP